MRSRARNRLPVLFEPLEVRQLMSSGFPSFQLNANLLINGDAESNIGAANNTAVVLPSGWTSNVGNPSFTAVQYGASGGLPGVNTPGPGDKANNFFAGGPGVADSVVTQLVDISSVGDGIDAGVIKATLSAWLGGWATEDDHVNVSMSFRDPNNIEISNVALPTVLAADRNNTTSLIQRSTTVNVPIGTTKIFITLEAIRTFGSYDDGYADDISLSLSSTSKRGYIHGSIFNDIDGDGNSDVGEKGVKGITVYVDKNENNRLDAAEIRTKTNKYGDYYLSNVPRGDARVSEVLPAGFRETYPHNLATVVGGLTSLFDPTPITQTSLIQAFIFNDVNGNGQQDGKEKALGKILVYFDFNDNRQADLFELDEITDNTSGAAFFTVPFGTYIVRVQAPKGYRATNLTNGVKVTLSKADVQQVGIFGLKKI